MDAIISRRNFMRGASVAAIAVGGVMLTGCSVSSIVKDIAEDQILKEDGSVKLGKYITYYSGFGFGGSAEKGGHIDVTIGIYHTDSALIGKKATDIITNASIGDIKLTEYADGQSSTVGEPEDELDYSEIRVDYVISAEAYSAFRSGKSAFTFTVTLGEASAVYTITNHEDSGETVKAKKIKQ